MGRWVCDSCGVAGEVPRARIPTPCSAPSAASRCSPTRVRRDLRPDDPRDPSLPGEVDGAGSLCASVEVDARGLVGDRWYAVVDGDGKLSSGKHSTRFRRRDAVFDFTSRTTDEGVRVTGRGGEWRVGDPDLDQALSRRHGRPRAGPGRGPDALPGRRRGLPGRHGVARLVPRAPRRGRRPPHGSARTSSSTPASPSSRRPGPGVLSVGTARLRVVQARRAVPDDRHRPGGAAARGVLAQGADRHPRDVPRRLPRRRHARARCGSEMRCGSAVEGAAHRCRIMVSTAAKPPGCATVSAGTTTGGAAAVRPHTGRPRAVTVPTRTPPGPRGRTDWP